MANQSAASQHVVGQTKDAGYQIGARRTFDVSPQHAWEVITSHAGRKLWLGDAPGFRLETGTSYRTADGGAGKIGVVSPGGHFRIAWQPGGWPKPSTIQVRVIPSGANTVISFHQDNLPGPKERRERQAFYAIVLDALEEALKPD